MKTSRSVLSTGTSDDGQDLQLDQVHFRWIQIYHHHPHLPLHLQSHPILPMTTSHWLHQMDSTVDFGCQRIYTQNWLLENLGRS